MIKKNFLKIFFLYHSTWKHVIYVLQEAFLFDILIGEYERDSFSLLTGRTIEEF